MWAMMLKFRMYCGSLLMVGLRDISCGTNAPSLAAVILTGRPVSVIVKRTSACLECWLSSTLERIDHVLQFQVRTHSDGTDRVCPRGRRNDWHSGGEVDPTHEGGSRGRGRQVGSTIQGQEAARIGANVDCHCARQD